MCKNYPTYPTNVLIYKCIYLIIVHFNNYCCKKCHNDLPSNSQPYIYRRLMDLHFRRILLDERCTDPDFFLLPILIFEFYQNWYHRLPEKTVVWRLYRLSGYLWGNWFTVYIERKCHLLLLSMRSHVFTNKLKWKNIHRSLDFSSLMKYKVNSFRVQGWTVVPHMSLPFSQQIHKWCKCWHQKQQQLVVNCVKFNFFMKSSQNIVNCKNASSFLSNPPETFFVCLKVLCLHKQSHISSSNTGVMCLRGVGNTFSTQYLYF